MFNKTKERSVFVILVCAATQLKNNNNKKNAALKT